MIIKIYDIDWTENKTENSGIKKCLIKHLYFDFDDWDDEALDAEEMEKELTKEISNSSDFFHNGFSWEVVSE